MTEFSYIYEHYGKQVYGFLLSLSGDEKIAEELTQETFYKAFLHIDRFEGKCSIYTWLCQIGKNAYFKEVKRKNKGVNKEVSADFDINKDFVMDIVHREQMMSVHKVLHEIPEPYREVFTLKVFGELKFKEIAEIFDKTESWAKVTYYRAKGKIVIKLKEEKE